MNKEANKMDEKKVQKQILKNQPHKAVNCKEWEIYKKNSNLWVCRNLLMASYIQFSLCAHCSVFTLCTRIPIFTHTFEPPQQHQLRKFIKCYWHWCITIWHFFRKHEIALITLTASVCVFCVFKTLFLTYICRFGYNFALRVCTNQQIQQIKSSKKIEHRNKCDTLN